MQKSKSTTCKTKFSENNPSESFSKLKFSEETSSIEEKQTGL